MGAEGKSHKGAGSSAGGEEDVWSSGSKGPEEKKKTREASPWLIGVESPGPGGPLTGLLTSAPHLPPTCFYPPRTPKGPTLLDSLPSAHWHHHSRLRLRQTPLPLSVPFCLTGVLALL